MRSMKRLSWIAFGMLAAGPSAAAPQAASPPSPPPKFDLPPRPDKAPEKRAPVPSADIACIARGNCRGLPAEKRFSLDRMVRKPTKPAKDYPVCTNTVQDQCRQATRSDDR